MQRQGLCLHTPVVSMARTPRTSAMQFLGRLHCTPDVAACGRLPCGHAFMRFPTRLGFVHGTLGVVGRGIDRVEFYRLGCGCVDDVVLPSGTCNHGRAARELVPNLVQPELATPRLDAQALVAGWEYLAEDHSDGRACRCVRRASGAGARWVPAHVCPSLAFLPTTSSNRYTSSASSPITRVASVWTRELISVPPADSILNAHYLTEGRDRAVFIAFLWLIHK